MSSRCRKCAKKLPDDRKGNEQVCPACKTKRPRMYICKNINKSDI